MTVFFSQLINGLSLGSIYALIALGYSMVYGIILLLNFAHGDVIMVGAYMSWFVMNQLGHRRSRRTCAISLYAAGRGHRKIATPAAKRISVCRRVSSPRVHIHLSLKQNKVIPSYYENNKTFYLGKCSGLTLMYASGPVNAILVLTFLVQKTQTKMCAPSLRMGAAA